MSPEAVLLGLLVVLLAYRFAGQATHVGRLPLDSLLGHSESCPRCLSSPLLFASLDRGKAKHRQSGTTLGCTLFFVRAHTLAKFTFTLAQPCDSLNRVRKAPPTF
jgi:hypothetical protein